MHYGSFVPDDFGNFLTVPVAKTYKLSCFFLLDFSSALIANTHLSLL